MIPANPVQTLTAAVNGTYTQAVHLESGMLGCLVLVNLTASGGTLPTLTVTINGISPDNVGTTASSGSATVPGTAYLLLASTALAGASTGVFPLVVYPNMLAVTNKVAAMAVPADIQLSCVVGGSGGSTITAYLSVVSLH